MLLLMTKYSAVSIIENTNQEKVNWENMQSS